MEFHLSFCSIREFEVAFFLSVFCLDSNVSCEVWAVLINSKYLKSILSMDDGGVFMHKIELKDSKCVFVCFREECSKCGT